MIPATQTSNDTKHTHTGKKNVNKVVATSCDIFLINVINYPLINAQSQYSLN